MGFCISSHIDCIASAAFEGSDFDHHTHKGSNASGLCTHPTREPNLSDCSG